MNGLRFGSRGLALQGRSPRGGPPLAGGFALQGRWPPAAGGLPPHPPPPGRRSDELRRASDGRSPRGGPDDRAASRSRDGRRGVGHPPAYRARDGRFAGRRLPACRSTACVRRSDPNDRAACCSMAACRRLRLVPPSAALTAGASPDGLLLHGRSVDGLPTHGFRCARGPVGFVCHGRSLGGALSAGLSCQGLRSRGGPDRSGGFPDHGRFPSPTGLLLHGRSPRGLSCHGRLPP